MNGSGTAHEARTRKISAKTARVPHGGRHGGVVDRAVLAATLERLLEPGRFSDYCPNGLQVEGRARVRRVVGGVTASLAFIERAIDAGADAILVHHGWFWRGEDPRILGAGRMRLARVLAADLNLFAYHLPLDAHPEVGNNAQLARLMNWPVGGRVGPQDLIWWGDLTTPATAAGLGRSLGRRLGRRPLLVGRLERPLRRIAWCTGGAQDFIGHAIDAGADAYVSGEISERTTHIAREAGIVYASAGHHATERFGVQALGAHLMAELGIDFRFIDDPNPV